MGNLWVSIVGDAIAIVNSISGPRTARQRLRLLALIALIGVGLNVPLALLRTAAVELAALLLLGVALISALNVAGVSALRYGMPGVNCSRPSAAPSSR